MDFTISEEQEAVRQSAEGIFTGLVTSDRVKETEATDERFDRGLWAELAKADLLGLALPEAVGGGGYGMVELSLLLEAQGRVVAPIPLWATVVLGALPMAEFGSAALQSQWLPGVVAGEVVLTAALADVAGDLANGGPGRSSVVASPRKKGGYKLSGTATAVPYAHVADRVLVPATTPDGGTVIAVVDPHARRVIVERAVTTNREVHPHLHFDKLVVTEADLLAGGDPARGRTVLAWMLERAWTGLCALQVGVAEAALAQTAEYLNTREQFGKPLSTFQGTMLRAADAAIDTEAIRVTLWQAAWRLDNGLDADRAVAVAIWFASDAGQRVVHATQHLHGGMGADVDYPVHRYFLWGKQIELLLGSGSSQLARLGRQLVADLRAGETVSA
jgi:alkylation response protein AidB-like acyl-CoA dehydrogenase